MRRYELSLSENYVSSWGLVEAIREIFQNAIDQENMARPPKDWYDDVEKESPNKMFFNFAVDSHNPNKYRTLSIGNKESILDVNSLLLGETTKSDDKRAIGKFGEGYKLALLVLTRLGKKIKIFNYGAREVWTAALKNSKKFNGAKTLQIEVEDKFFWQSVPDNNLVYQIYPLTEDEQQDIYESNLNLQVQQVQQIEGDDVLTTAIGQILLQPQYRGRVFVAGLYISTDEKLHYGYNFKPEYIELDRDRRMIQSFELQWKTSEMWRATGDDRIIDMVMQNADDVRYIRTYGGYTNDKFKLVADKAYEDLKDRYGPLAYPVSTQKEMETILKTRGGPSYVKPIVVYESHQFLIESSRDFIKAVKELPPVQPTKEPNQVIWEFYVRCADEGNMEGAQLTELWVILMMSYVWKETK